MSETLLNMRTRVAKKLGGKGSWKTEIINALNEASQQLAWDVKPHEAWADTSFTTVDDDFDYGFAVTDDINASDVYAPVFVRNETDNHLMINGSYEEFLRNRNDDSDTGKPSKWTRYKNQLILYNSIPDGGTTRTIRVYYIRSLTFMSADTDTFDLNDEWIYPTEDLAAAMVSKDLRDFDASLAFMNAYQAAISGRQTPEMFDDAAAEGGFIPYDNNRMDGFQL